MKRRLQTKHAFVVTVLIGALISASHYVVDPLDVQGDYKQSVPLLLRRVRT